VTALLCQVTSSAYLVSGSVTLYVSRQHYLITRAYVKCGNIRRRSYLGRQLEHGILRPEDAASTMTFLECCARKEPGCFSVEAGKAEVKANRR